MKLVISARMYNRISTAQHIFFNPNVVKPFQKF